MSEKLAIDGGAPLRSEPYPSWPQWDEHEEKALRDTLHSGAWWAPGGTQVEALQREFAAYHDAQYGVAVTNGSAALEVCLRAAGVDWGDEIITTPYTFIATANSCLLVGALPRFRGYSARYLEHGSLADRGGHHAPHEGDHARAHGWRTGGYGCHPTRSRGDTACW